MKEKDLDIIDAAWNDPRPREKMPRIKFRVKYEQVDRSMPRWSPAPNPSFDTDEDIEDFLLKLFRKLWKFWDRRYIEGRTLVLPPFDVFVEMVSEGGDNPDNDLYSTLNHYLDQFFPYVPENPEVRAIDESRKTDEGSPMPPEALYVITRDILDRHQA